MDFNTIYDAQVFIVQGVTQRKSLDSQLSTAATQEEKNSLKSQIRDLQWNIDKANKYLLSNALPALRYSNDIFSIDELVKTPWDNESSIPGTLQYDVSEQTGTIESIQDANALQIEELNTIMIETDSLLRQNKQKLEAARLLPDTSDEKENIITESKNAIKNLSTSLRSLQYQKELIEPKLTLPSTEESEEDKFSKSIRNSLRASLLAKPGYVEQTGDIDAAIKMRKLALDALYTAKNEDEKKAAKERLQKVYDSLSPSVPVTRKNMADEELFLSYTIEQIGAYNEVLYPKTLRLDTAQSAYEIARDGGNQTEIDSAKIEYDAANEDYNLTLYEIKKLYDQILQFRSSEGLSAMFPGTNTVQTYTPPAPKDGSNSSGNSTGYELIWDTHTDTFVSQKDATASPGRYVSTQYTNAPLPLQATDAQKLQKMLSENYLESSKKEAEYTYKKETEHLIFQNENRYERIFEANQDLEKLDADWAKQKEKLGLTDEDYINYQAKKNAINGRIAEDQKIISDNKKLIDTAQQKRDAGLDPFKALETTQQKAVEYVDGTDRKIPATLPTNSAQALSKDFYDAKSERELAERQLLTASNITNKAEQDAINEAMSRGLTEAEAKKSENWNAELKGKYDSAKTKEGQQSALLSGARDNEVEAATKAKAFMDKVGNTEEAQKIMELNGLRPYDIEKSLILAGKQSETLDQQSRKIEKELTSQYSKKLEDIGKRQTQIENEKEELYNKISEIENDPDLDEVSKNKAISLLQEEITALEVENAKLESDSDKINQDLENVSEVAEQLAREQLTTEDTNADLANTGFEGLNNGAPFYMQFPTLNAITDFKMRNGVDPYGAKTTDEIARDAVVIKIFETVPGVSRSEEVLLPNGAKYIKNIPQKTNINTLGSFTIYPSHSDGPGNWLQQTHSHQWESGERDTIAQLFQVGGDILTGTESAFKLFNAGLTALNSGSLKGNDLSAGVYNRQVDVLDYYKISNHTPIKVTFNLFTRNNFLNDVFRPIMFLTALGYPKRAMQGNFGKLFQQILGNAAEYTSKLDSDVAKRISAAIQEFQNKNYGAKAESFEKKLAEFGGLGPYRFFITKRPEYLTVRHASGLFYYPVAYIQEFSYNFKGPWYNYHGVPLESTKDLDTLISTKIQELAPAPEKTFREKMNETFTDLARNIRETFRPPPKPVPRPSQPESRIAGSPGGLLQLSDSDVNFLRSKGLPFAYPSWAECTITFKNATPFFRDDFMALFYESQTGGENLVSLTQELTNQQQFSFNGRTTAEGMVDDAIKDQSEKRWH
jgi:hypothetical protein